MSVSAARKMASGSVPRRSLLLAPALWLLPRPAPAAVLYAIGPGQGSIGFAVSDMGLFTCRGQFMRFSARLALDPGNPGGCRIAADVDADSLDTPWPQAAAMLRSPAFFDVARFPRIRFRSTGVAPIAPGRFRVHGVLEMRGMSRPLVLAGALASPPSDAGAAEFALQGQLRRSAYGMVADPVLVGDQVTLAIRARLRLPPGPALSGDRAPGPG